MIGPWPVWYIMRFAGVFVISGLPVSVAPTGTTWIVLLPPPWMLLSAVANGIAISNKTMPANSIIAIFGLLIISH